MVVGKKSGYTIVEVLIFTVVSAGLFLIAMTAIGGRQQQVQFSQAVRELDSKLKDVMNDVTTGYFPNKNQVRCIIANNAPDSERPQLQTGATVQGTSDNCIFVGRAIQFGPIGTGTTPEAKDYMYIYTLVGRRTVSGGDRDVASIAESNPVAIAPTNVGSPLPDYTEKIPLKWGLRVTRVVIPSPSAVDYGTIGFFNTFSATHSTDLVSESQAVDLAAITNTRMIGSNPDTEYSAVSTINTITDDSNETAETLIVKNPADGILLCLSDSTGRKASILLSSQARRLGTTISFDNVNRSICT